MKAIALGILLLVVPVALTAASEPHKANEAPVVRLAPFQVKGGAFSVEYKWDKAGKITVARVSIVTARSPGEKAGLRVGDALVRIDGREVVGMPHDDLARILAADLSPEHPIEIYSFVGQRFLGDDVKVDWKFTYKP